MTPEAFDARVDRSGDCWLWMGHRRTDGYGLISQSGQAGRRNIYAHRQAYERWVGPIPERACIRHSCDNRACVRPEHLRIGTRRDNSADMVAHGRSLRGERHPGAVLTDEQVAAVFTLRLSGWTQSRIAGLFRVDRRTIGLIVNGKRRLTG